MKLANGKEVTVGVLIVGPDAGGNLVAGAVMQLLERADGVRVLGAPLVVITEKALLVEDAYALALQVPELTTKLATAVSRADELQSLLDSSTSLVHALQEQLNAAREEVTAKSNQTSPTVPTSPTASPAAPSAPEPASEPEKSPAEAPGTTGGEPGPSSPTEGPATIQPPSPASPAVNPS